MRVFFPPEVQRSAAILDKASPECAGLLMPGAGIICMEAPEGYVLQQEYAGDYFRLAVFHMHIRQSVSLLFQPARPAIAVGYMLNGSAMMAKVRSVREPFPVHRGLYYVLPFTRGHDHELMLRPGKYEAMVLLLEEGIQEELRQQLPELITVYRDVLQHKRKPVDAYPVLPILPELKRYLRDISGHCQPPELFPYFLKEKVTGMLRMLVGAVMNTDAHRGPHAGLVKFLEGNLDMRIRTEDLLREFGGNRRQLVERFREVMQMTPRQYHIRLRMEEARRQVLAGVSVGHIADGLGYRNDSNFCGDFKAYFNQTPTAVQREAGLRE